MPQLQAQAYVSWGLWVARCPADGCLGAEHFGHAPITGFVGGLTQVGFRCGRCGLVCASVWPANAQDIWALLSQRPIVETRNWELGETLEDLVVENAQHGLLEPPDTGGESLSLRLTDNGRLTPFGIHLAAAGSRPAIGA